MSGSPRTLLQVSAVLGVIVLMITAWIVTNREKTNRTEAELIRDLREKNAEQEAKLIEDPSYEGFPEDPELAEHLIQTNRVLRGPLTDCVELWPDRPLVATVRIQTDVAGRLIGLAVQDAPKGVADCMLVVMKRGQYPRGVDDVAPMPLSPR